jgi:DnaK suppressor protein
MTSDVEVARALAEREAEVRERAEQLRGLRESVVEAADGANVDDEHDPEGSTLAFEREQVAALLRQAEADLVELAAARQRLEEGRYGRCEVCGGPIGEGRLEARPTARTCVDCASSVRRR